MLEGGRAHFSPRVKYSCAITFYLCAAYSLLSLITFACLFAPCEKTKLEFRRMALPLKDIHQLHLKIVNTCEVPIAKSGDKQGILFLLSFSIS